MAGQHLRVVAIDFDGTLADGGEPAAAVLDALDAARSRGLHALLVTGRIMQELHTVFPGVLDHFDAVVAENGAVLVAPSGTRLLGPPPPDELVDALVRRGVVFRRGEVVLAAAGHDEHDVLEAVRSAGFEWQLVRNRSELMILPSGVNKGRGLVTALGQLGLSRHNAVAVGDAENDHSLFEVCEIGVAVANAVPSLLARADLVLDQPDGDGVRSLLQSDLLAGRTVLHPSRWEVTIGVDERGDVVTVPGSRTNMLIGGGSGDGKSHVAGLLAERLIALGYSMLIVDPEGDHGGLGELEGVLVVGGDRHLPPPAAVVPLLRHRFASVVIDLSDLPASEQDAYLAALPAEIDALQRSSGLPHWVLIDEADRAVGRAGASLRPCNNGVRGWCLVTWRPGELSADALASVDIVLALTSPRPDHTLVDLVAAVADVPTDDVANRLANPVGHLVVARRDQPGSVRVVHPAPRITGHFRHDHKYATGQLELERRFWIRTAPDRLTGGVLANLAELEQELATCSRDVLRHHCPRHDLSAWVIGVFHAEQLADAIRRVEARVRPSSPAAIVESARLDLIAVLQRRHEQ